MEVWLLHTGSQPRYKAIFVGKQPSVPRPAALLIPCTAESRDGAAMLRRKQYLILIFCECHKASQMGGKRLKQLPPLCVGADLAVTCSLPVCQCVKIRCKMRLCTRVAAEIFLLTVNVDGRIFPLHCDSRDATHLVSVGGCGQGL